MNRRPRIKPGDIVKFSKKGKLADYPWPDNLTMIVTEVSGFDSTDSDCLIHCRAVIDGRSETIQAYRHHLWFTGKNVRDMKRSVRVLNSKE